VSLGSPFIPLVLLWRVRRPEWKQLVKPTNGCQRSFASLSERRFSRFRRYALLHRWELGFTQYVVYRAHLALTRRSYSRLTSFGPCSAHAMVPFLFRGFSPEGHR